MGRGGGERGAGEGGPFLFSSRRDSGEILKSHQNRHLQLNDLVPTFDTVKTSMSVNMTDSNVAPLRMDMSFAWPHLCT